MHRKPTWLGCISPPPLGSYAVIPPSVGVLYKSPHILEELTEGHLASLIDSIVEKGSPPQERVLSEQDTVNTRQTFFSRIDWLQTMLFTSIPIAPRLAVVVHAPKIMSS